MTQSRGRTIVSCLNRRFYKRSSPRGLPWFREQTADGGEEEKGLIGELYETSEIKVGAFGFKIDLKPIVKRVWRYLRFRRTVKPYRGPPMTLGAAAAAQVRLIMWCKACQHQVEPDPAEMAARYGADTSILDWRERLVCSRCGGRQADMVVTGTKPR